MNFMKKTALAMAVGACSVTASAQTQEQAPCCKECHTTHSEAFLYAKDKEWEPAEPGVVRQVMGYDGQVMLVKVKFETGAVGAAHRHYHTQTTYVASGKFEFTIGGETRIVEAGDGLYMAPDVLHGCKCLEAGVLIDCFTPMRETFLKKK